MHKNRGPQVQINFILPVRHICRWMTHSGTSLLVEHGVLHSDPAPSFSHFPHLFSSKIHSKHTQETGFSVKERHSPKKTWALVTYPLKTRSIGYRNPSRFISWQKNCFPPCLGSVLFNFLSVPYTSTRSCNVLSTCSLACLCACNTGIH